MFNALKNFIAEVGGAQAVNRRFGEDDYRLAAAALLVHIADVDGKTDPAEQSKLAAIIEARFGLDAEATSELMARAEESDREAVDFYRFTSVLTRALDEDGRRGVIEMMWQMAFADGVIDEFEDNTISRLAELLGVSARDRVLARQRVAGEAPETPAFPGPWSAAPAKGKA